MNKKIRCYSKSSLVQWVLMAVIVIGSESVASAAGDESSLSLGTVFYGGTGSSNMNGSTGYTAQFQTVPRTGRVRMSFGSQFEYSRGTYVTSSSCTFMAGHALFGAQFSSEKSEVITPFAGITADLGWSRLAISSGEDKIGLVYGGQLNGGVTIKAGSDSSAKAIRLTTSYRVLRGSSALNADGIIFSVGFAF